MVFADRLGRSQFPEYISHESSTRQSAPIHFCPPPALTLLPSSSEFDGSACCVDDNTECLQNPTKLELDGHTRWVDAGIVADVT